MSEPGEAAVVDDDALLGFIPPSWKPGSSWVVEQWTWHYQGLARVRPRQQERYAEVYFRVERIDENEAVLSALATEPAGAEDAATIRVRLRPFHAASFAAGTHFPFSSLSLNDPSTDYLEDFLIRFPAAPSRDVAPRDPESEYVYLARARLIVVDEQVITPMPWSD